MKQKHINYRKPKLQTTAKKVSRSLLNTSSSATHSAIKGLAKHQSETNETNNRYINVMEAQQSINFILANIGLSSRRMQRANQEHARLVATGKEDGYIIIAWGWIFDHTWFVVDLIWGVIQPIILILVMLVIRIVLMIVFTTIGFYLLFKLFIS